MKKTIAKIMAAAMVLSTIPAVALPSLTAEADALKSDVDAATLSQLQLYQESTKLAEANSSSDVTTTYSESSPLVLSGLTANTSDGKTTSIDTSLLFNARAYVSTSHTSGTTITSEQLAVTPSVGKSNTVEINTTDIGALYLDDGDSTIGWEYSSSAQKGVITDVYVNQYGKIRFEFAQDTTAQNVLSNLGTTPLVVKLTIAPNVDTMISTETSSAAVAVTPFKLWVKFTGTNTASASGTNSAVKLANDVVIPLSLELNTSGLTATIVAADPNKTGKDASGVATEIYKTDLVKGQTVDLSEVTGDGKVYKITKINARVFKEAKFKKVIAKNVKHINQGAFRKCKQLTTVNLGTDKAIRKIHSKAFYNDKKLSTIKLDGRNLKVVGSQAFQGVKKNCAIKVKGSKTKFNKAAKLIKKGVKTTKIKVSRVS